MGVNNAGGREERFYAINVSLTAATGASVTTSPAVQIGALPFLWEALGADWDDSNGTWDIKITDNGADRAFSADKFPVAGLLGSTEREPYKLLVPYQFAAGSSIMVEATNSGSGTDTLKLVFVGRRLPLVM